MEKFYFNTLAFMEDNGLTASTLARKIGTTPGAVYSYIRKGRISKKAFQRLKDIVPLDILKKYEMSEAVELKKDKHQKTVKPCRFVRISPKNEPVVRRDFATIPLAVNRLIDGYASIRPLLFTKYLPIIEVVRESIMPVSEDVETSLRYFLDLKKIEHKSVNSEILLLVYYLFRS